MKYSAFPIITSLIHRYLLPGEIKSYLEIGVNEGFSLFNVLEHCPKITDLVLCDNWLKAFGGYNRGSHDHIEAKLIDKGFPMEYVTFLDGDSKVKIPEYFSQHPGKMFDFGFVDGDHSAKGLLADLVNMVEHAHILAVHDIRHPSHSYLKDVLYDFYEGAMLSDKRRVRDAFLLIDDGYDMGMLLSKIFFDWNKPE